MNTDPMTPQQREAIQKAWSTLTEWFDGVLLVVDWETGQHNEDGKMEDAREGYWHGGSMRAIGLSRFAEKRIIDSGRPAIEPETE
jgi:hypothetical protein